MLPTIISQNIYLVLLILTTTEWPITTFIGAGFAAQWYLNFWWVALIAFTGDIIGDIVLYSLGRSSHRITKIKRFQHFSQEKNFFSKVLAKQPFFYFLITKITPYLATPALIFTWVQKMKFKSFMGYSIIVTIIVKTLYLSIGYLGSISVLQVERFFDGWRKIMLYVLIGLLLFVCIKQIYKYFSIKLKNKVSSKINNPS